MLKADVHVHSDYSNDGVGSMRSYCERAVDLGLDIICFTDHVDSKKEIVRKNGRIDLKRYFDEIARLKDRYANKGLKVLTGIEVAEPYDDPRQLEELNSMPFDFILGSVHYYWYSMNPNVVLDRSLMRTARGWDVYWEEEIKLSECDGLDALAHLDYPKRFISERKIDYDALRTIFENIIKKGCAIEINTSFIRKGGGEPLPSEEILAYYAQMGGTMVTIGSDAHYVSELYVDVEYSMRYMPKELTAGYFENRKFYPL